MENILRRFFWALLLVSFTSAGSWATLVTDVDTNGRDGGYYSLFQMEHWNGIPFLSKSTCYTDRLRGNNIDRITCEPNVQKIPLRDLLQSLAPSLDNDVFSAAVTLMHLETAEAINPEGLEYVLKHFKSELKSVGLFGLFENASEENKRSSETQKQVGQFLEVYKDKIDLLKQIADPKKHFILFKNAQTEPELYRNILQWMRQFQSAIYRKVGTHCRTEIPGHVVSANGGCTLVTNQLAYSQSEFRIDRLQNDYWLNRDIAIQRCSTLTAGGYYNWRLPTEKELMEAQIHSGAIGFDPLLYYWTQDVFDDNFVETKTYRLGEEVIASKAYPILLGIKITLYNGANITPVFDEIIYSTVNTDRVLKGEFEVEARHYKLVRPAVGKRFDIIRHRLLNATGILNYSRELRRNAPGIVGYVRSDYNDGATVAEPRVYTRDETVLSSTAYSEAVNPLNYVSYQLPADVLKSQIGLLCVRSPSKLVPN